MAESVEPAGQDDVVDAELVTGSEPAQELVVREPTRQLSVVPRSTAAELTQRLQVIQEAMKGAMVADVDYGVIPGTKGKPTLLKPGAEKLMSLFLLDLQPAVRNVWGPGDHLTVECEVTAFDAESGRRLGKGMAICSTREKRYAKRKMERTCPECGKENIRRSKPKGNEEPGWYCWRKTDGCGANFQANDKRITEQEEGEKDNPDLPDTWNTVAKIAEKRAKVDAVLAVTGASAIFTQDLEDKATEERDAGVQASSGAPEPEAPERVVLSPRGVASYRSLIEGAGLDVAAVVKEARVESGRLEDVDASAAANIKAIVETRQREREDAEREEAQG